MPKVVNKKHSSYDVFIGRPSKWGNPYRIGYDGTRDEVIAKYSRWLWEQIKSEKISIDDLLNLDGKRLGCYCKPLPCHGDIVVKAVNWAKNLE